MGWNYRVMRQDHAQAGERPDVLYQIHEVQYGSGGEVSSWTEEPVEVVSDTRDGLLEVLAMMADALGHPVLSTEDGSVVDPERQLSDELRQALRATHEYFEHEDGKFSRAVAPEEGSQHASDTREAKRPNPESDVP